MCEEIDTLVTMLSELPEDISTAMRRNESDISNKLDAIISLLSEQRIAFEKYYEEPVQFQTCEYKARISDITFEEISNNKFVFLLGYRRKDIENYFDILSQKHSFKWKYISFVEKPDDLGAILANGENLSFLVFDSRNFTWERENQEILHSASAKNSIDIIIGKGPSAKSICLDLPVCNYVFFDSSDLYLPNRTKEIFDCCFSNKELEE